MKRMVQLLAKENTETHIVASFFIYGQGVTLQKSRMGLYSALIHQLYLPLSTAFEGLTREFQNKTDTRGKYGDKWEWTLTDIRSHLFEALELGSETKSIMIFVDALDEAGEEEAQRIIRDFDGLLSRLSGSHSKMKVCFSCRHYPDLRLSHAVAVSVEKHNRQDIQTVIDNHLQKLKPEERTMFRTEVVKNSGGIFHWAALVIDRAVRERKKGRSFPIVFSTFREGQADLYQLYEALLSELEGDDRVQAIRLFQWMLFTKRPLASDELRHAMALSHDMPEKSISEYSIGKYFTDRSDLKARIMDLSKGLVEARYEDRRFEIPSRTSIQFVHQSVVDYLLESGLQTLEAMQGTTMFSSINVRAHFQLSRSCLRFLFMSEFEAIDRAHEDKNRRDRDFLTLLDELELGLKAEKFRIPGRSEAQHYGLTFYWDQRTELVASLPNDNIGLLSYCWNHWVDHILQIQEEKHLLPSYRDYEGLIHQNEKEQRSLPNQYEQCDLLDCFSWPESDTFLQMCVRFHNGLGASRNLVGLQNTFSKIWNVKNIVHAQLATNIWSFALCGSSLIHFLALSGLRTPLQRIIDSPGASLEVWDREGRTPLMYAILGFAVEIAIDLIRAKVDVNTQDIYGNTALHLASFCGEERVVEALLEAGANVNLERIGGATSIHLAVIAQHPLIVAKLLHENADAEKVVLVDHPDFNRWTSLDIAASDGDLDLARLLIRNGKSLGRSLFHAALFDRADMVDFLVQSGAKVEDQDSFGRTPLIIAVAERRIEAAIRLIDAKTPLDHVDSDGKTALFHAVIGRHSTEMARALLKAGADPNLRNKKGLSPIARAREFDVGMLLLSFGAKPQVVRQWICKS